MDPDNRNTPPPCQDGLAATARFWKNKNPRCKPPGSSVPNWSPKPLPPLIEQFGAQSPVDESGPVHGPNKTVPVMVAVKFEGVAEVAVHFTPLGYEPAGSPVRVWNAVGGQFLPEFDVTSRLFAVLK